MSDTTKLKVQQLYRYLKKATELRYAPIRTLASQEKVIRFSEMPVHPSLQIQHPINAADETQNRQEFELRVKRPLLTHCPAVPKTLLDWLLPGYDDPNKQITLVQSQNIMVSRQFKDDPIRVQDHQAFIDARQLDPKASPPSSIASWLKDGWDDPELTPEVRLSLNRTETVLFADDPNRVISLDNWKAARSQWAEPELRARQAMAFYERIYELYVNLEKDGENIELMVADGRLQWIGATDTSDQIQIDHPVLLKRVELKFNANVPEFLILDTEREPELYSSMLADLKDLLPVAIRNRTDDLAAVGYHPMGFEETTGFLRAFIQTISPITGQFIEGIPAEPISTTPRLYRDPVLVLRKRSRGIANAVNSIIEDIEGREIFPPALGQIIGNDNQAINSDLGHDAPQTPPNRPNSTGISDDDILLAKEANDEQLQIIRRLDRSGSVIVQGPPGTGKTHTIGNLIGHLLAQGKSILVTAQTAKALRVVREQVPDMLRPLAVSVLGSDQSARGQLENAISSITQRMTGDSADSLLEKATQHDEERKKLIRLKKELKRKLRQALENEYRAIRLGTKSFTPTEAARHVREHEAEHNWIPAPLKLGADLTLNEQELARLYALGTQFETQEAADCELSLPDFSLLPNESMFSVMVTEYQNLLTSDRTTGQSRWAENNGRSESLAAIAAVLDNEFSNELKKQAWRPRAIVAGIQGGSTRAVWLKAIDLIEEAFEAQSKYLLVLHQQPRTSQDTGLTIQKKIVNEILEYLQTGGKLGFLQLITRGEWKQFIKSNTVAAGEPSIKEHFEALRCLINLESARKNLQPIWDQLIGEKGDKTFANLGPNPEQSCRALVPEIKRCLDWHAKTWQPLEEKIKTEGFLLNDVLATIPREPSAVSDYQLVEHIATVALPPLLAAELVRRKIKEYERGFKSIEAFTAGDAPFNTDTGCIGQIKEALRTRDTVAYGMAMAYARRLTMVKPLVTEHKELLARLSLVAPIWAQQLSNRTKPHNANTAPGDIGAAWTWRQLREELIERDALNANEIQIEIDKVDTALREITLMLIDAKAWGNQLSRMKENNAIRRALVGWLDTMKLLSFTRQENRRQTLLAEGRKLMRQCGQAVPVWIMPISIVAENFDPRTTRFDVVIIDEASQADLNALIPLYLGKQVIVVGDHEQVTPLAVGQNQTLLENIRQQTLTDIPNSHLFDAKFSIYDIARQSFGDAIRLVEHFRCVPEIIAFSNQLSYEGTIKPLREANSSVLKPACVSIRVQGDRDKDVNHAEARRIVDLVKAMILHPGYAQKSIGIITMLGDKQTYLIQSLILKEISGTEIEARRIMVGNSSEFQGDERDVVLLSMVDSPEREGPMRLTGEGAFELVKKRYNVAASRARDQLIVVHSFDPDLHLKPGDMRLRLMQHIKNPLATLRTFQQAALRTESPFERSVLKILTEAGFKVRTQWEVGYYRIDMVIEGGGKRLAVECDGDRYHPIEKLADDIERQTILERLGWQFVRIRGSAFYRDAEAAMKPVFARIKELEIPQEVSDGPNDPPTTDDLTLIHELEALIERMNQPADIVMPSPPGEETQRPLELISTPHEITSPDEHDSDLIEVTIAETPVAIVNRMGGTVELENFIRALARSKGFVRMRQSVRDRMMDELKVLINDGHLVLEHEIVRLP